MHGKNKGVEFYHHAEKMEKVMKTKVQKYIIFFILVREWIECGEFRDTNRIILVGDPFFGLILKVFLHKSKIHIFLCDKKTYIDHYTFKKHTKWILTSSISKKKEIEEDVLIVPFDKVF